MFPGGGGGGGGGGRGGGARLQGILASLRDEDETTVLTGLSELCEHVSISTEDSMLAFPTETVVPLVVALLAREHNPDLMLLAARALTFLADVFPPACSSIIRHGAVPAFCTRLLTIEYIDLAEQSLQALEKLSHDHAPSLLRAGALVAVLSYIDFFQTGVQRVAAATAANICRGLTPEHTDAVSTAAPILIGLLQYQDAKIVDSACLALTRVAEAFSRSPAHMQTLVGFGLINSIVEMVAVSEAGSITSQLSTSTFYGLVKLLTTCAAGSPAVAEALLAAGVSGTLRTLLATSPMLTSVGASPGNVLRSAEQLQDLVALAVQLLPPVPAAAPAAAAPAGAAAAEGGACALSAHLREHPEAARRVAEDLFPAMLRVHAASATPQVKRLCLAALARMLHHTPAPALRPVLSELPVAGLVAALLGSKDAEVAGQGMQAAETLMAKLPDVYTQLFLKEGVVHAMEQLAASAAPADAAAAPAEGVSTRRRSQAAGAPAAPSAAERSAAAAAAAAAAKAPAGDALRSALGVRARSFCARYFIDEHGEPIGARPLQPHCRRRRRRARNPLCFLLLDPFCCCSPLFLDLAPRHALQAATPRARAPWPTSARACPTPLRWATCCARWAAAAAASPSPCPPSSCSAPAPSAPCAPTWRAPTCPPAAPTAPGGCWSGWARSPTPRCRPARAPPRRRRLWWRSCSWRWPRRRSSRCG
jgi:E3 ubiquitin-protein ligase TRIP12